MAIDGNLSGKLTTKSSLQGSISGAKYATKEQVAAIADKIKGFILGNFAMHSNDEQEIHPTRNNPDGDVKATGTDKNNLSIGKSSIATGERSIAFGNSSGQNGSEYIYSSEATGISSVAGNGSLASGAGSIAVGGSGNIDYFETSESPTYRRTVCSGIFSIATGSTTKVSGTYSFGGGQRTKVEGNIAVGFGNDCEANHLCSVVFGARNKSARNYQTVIGNDSEEDGTASLVVGAGESAEARANCFTTGNDGTEDYITVGDTKITESQLTQLLALLNPPV